MEVLVDSNVILDWLQCRQPFYGNARNVMERCIFGNQSGYVTAHSLCDIFYILRKDFPVERRLSLINLLAEYFSVIPESREDFQDVTSSPETRDLEDGLQAACAKRCGLDYIITRNTKDFEHSEIPAIEPQDFLKLAPASCP